MALCEFGCPSLDYVYDMTWAEFLIRQYAYRRKMKREEFLAREIAYASIIGPHFNPKKIPSKEKYWSLKEQKPISDNARERIKEALRQFHEENK